MIFVGKKLQQWKKWKNWVDNWKFSHKKIPSKSFRDLKWYSEQERGDFIFLDFSEFFCPILVFWNPLQFFSKNFYFQKEEESEKCLKKPLIQFASKEIFFFQEIFHYKIFCRGNEFLIVKIVAKNIEFGWNFFLLRSWKQPSVKRNHPEK